MHGCLAGTDIWLEMKKTQHWRVNILPSQIAWHTLRHMSGGRSFFCIRRINNRSDDLYVINGKHCIKLRDLGVRGVPVLCACTGGPSHWDWDEVLRTVAIIPQ